MSDVVAARPRSLRLLIILLIGLPCMDMCMHVMLLERLIKSEEFLIGLLIGRSLSWEYWLAALDRLGFATYCSPVSWR